jgi:hypothetical protein
MTAKRIPGGTPAPAGPQVRVASLDEFRPNAANHRNHDHRNMKAIGDSIDQFGPGRSLVAGPDGVIYAGNGTLAQARARGMEALVVRPERNQIVVVDRGDLSATEATALGIADNRATDLSTNDDAILAQLLETLPDAEREAAGFSDEEFKGLMASLEPPAAKVAGSESSEPRESRPQANTPNQWIIIIECTDEIHQAELLDRFMGEGLTCKAIVT